MVTTDGNDDVITNSSVSHVLVMAFGKYYRLSGQNGTDMKATLC